MKLGIKRAAAMFSATIVGCGIASTAAAYEAGDWIARVGTHYVDPASDNGDVVTVDAAPGLTASVVYFVAPTIAVDLLVAAPYRHDIHLKDGGSKVASTDHLPPTLSLVWYPAVAGKLKPYVGAGLNYTMFFNEQTTGALAGTHLSLDDSLGLAAVAGLQVDLAPHWGLMVDLRYMDIDTDARLNGADLGTVTIDPIGFGLALSYQF